MKNDFQIARYRFIYINNLSFSNKRLIEKNQLNF